MNPAELKGRKFHCDLNVPYHAEDKLTDRLKFIAKLGWDAVAITTIVKSGEVPRVFPLFQSISEICYKKLKILQKSKFHFHRPKLKKLMG